MQDMPQHAPPQAIVLQVVHLKTQIGVAMKNLDTTSSNFFKGATPVKIDSPSKYCCSDMDMDCIQQIVTILAENGKIALLFKQNELRELGSRISSLHPLTFLTVIFSSSDLKEKINHVFKDNFKKNAFMSELSSRLFKQMDKEKFSTAQIALFAKNLNHSSDHLLPFFEICDWEGLVNFLIRGA